MGVARIAGCTVIVDSRSEPGCSFADAVYVISGEGAEKLRAVCERYGFGPGAFENGQFVVEGKNYDYCGALAGSPASDQLITSLERAAEPPSLQR